MKKTWILWIGVIASLGAMAAAPARPRTVILAGTLLDGRGKAMKNATIEVEGSKIVAVHPGRPPRVDYDLSEATVMPGIIDTHVHISWHFDADGRAHDPETPEESDHALPYGLENAFVTLMGGVTTVRSLGSPADKQLKTWIQDRGIPGCRVLTSLTPIDETTGDPEAIRKHVRDMAQQGADVIKIFASQSIRDGGGPTLSQEQLDAACGEAKALSLRSAVHAHGIESARRSVMAGCTSIEHGVLLDDETLQFIADHGTYFDPNIGLIFQNYFENKEHFIGTGNYTEEGFARMHDAVPKALVMFQHALKTRNLKIVFGTDAVAGSHGRNLEELIYRVQQGGQSPMDAIVSATSVSAESLGLQKEIGSIEPGFGADIIAVPSGVLRDITALRKVLFVMKSGKVVKYNF